MPTPARPSRRITLTLDAVTAALVADLAARERRSAANMAGVLLVRGLDPARGDRPLAPETRRYLRTRRVLRLVRGAAAA